MKWMEDYINAVDAHKALDNEPYSNWVSSSHIFTKSTGETISGGAASWTTLGKELYTPFASHLHDPFLLLCWENEEGWEMFGAATLYWNLAVSGDGQKVKDRKGREWDGAGPASFKSTYVRQDGEIRLAGTQIFADQTGAMRTMLKRGMLKREDLLK
ncbi:uncharacterized protein ALTATR162_LOCUS35 [Alternaria atra]|uniref:Uncharacterized protein n=1 Tax=Alternaria atra TaxID=119953 RepID=A0A8J2HQR8_9PLEO|nr:uncharacterized protein ALTATR162_LOCUS35 [Alternaria atra]CAG5137076.1 unnamed protein product [Alternaria atra]